MSKSNPLLKRAIGAWRVMKRRCLDQGFRDYPRYGGAGIKICPQWLASFEQFLKDVGLPPTTSHWLGRRNTAGHYVPENVLWTTQAEQKRRRQYCRRVILNGQTMTAAEAGRLPGQPTRNSVLRRWDSGLSLEHPKLSKIYRRSMWITYRGETLPLPEWARRLEIRPQVLWHRIKSGMAIEKALTPGLFRETHKKPTINRRSTT